MSSTPKLGQPEYSNYIISNDESDNNTILIEFIDAKSNAAGASLIDFKAFLTDFSDDFSSNWSSKNVYGRMDPVYNYENTTRKITLSFDLPSFDVEEAAWNSTKLSKLVQYTYPVYNNVNDNNAYGKGINRHIMHSPIIGAKFANLIRGIQPGTYLPGFLEGVSIKPEIDAGVFQVNRLPGNSKSLASQMVRELSTSKNLATKGLIKQKAITDGGSEYLLFKLYKVNLTYVPIHTQMLGRTAGNSEEEQLFRSFPNGLRLRDIRQQASASPGSSADSRVDSPFDQDAFT